MLIRNKTEVRFALSSLGGRLATSPPALDMTEMKDQGRLLKNNKKINFRGRLPTNKAASPPPPQNQIGAWFCSTLVLPSVQFYGFVYCICHGASRTILKGYPAHRTGSRICGCCCYTGSYNWKESGPGCQATFWNIADF